MKYLVIIYILSLALLARGSELSKELNLVNTPEQLLSEIRNVRAYGKSFVIPNERHPEHSLPILEKTQSGLGVYVGTERGFVGAAVNPKIEKLLLLDVNPNVNLYNSVNAQLLLLAQNREEYLSLRSANDFSLWEKAVEKYLASLPDFNNSDAQYTFNLKFPFIRAIQGPLEFLQNEQIFQLWRTWQKEISPIMESFGSANYLSNSTQWKRLSNLAKNNQIDILKLDLAATPVVARLVDNLKKKGTLLSVLDVSNAWQMGYVPADEFYELLDIFSLIANDHSLIMVTEQKMQNLEWTYLGFSFDYLSHLLNKMSPRKSGASTAFLFKTENLPISVIGLLNPPRMGLKSAGANSFSQCSGLF